jgi:hypothetical protein
MTGKKPHSLAGEIQLWSFDSGPTAGSTYEHTFNNDGTVIWRDAMQKAGMGKDGPKKQTPATEYASFPVAPGMHLVSYLAKDSGYTLTVLVNTEDRRLHGYASNATEWYPVTGKLVA